MTEALGVFFLAVAAGVVGSMLGIGGGVVMIPLLTLLFGLPIKTAIAASIICVIATSVVGQQAFMKRGLTHVRLGLLLAVASALGSLIGGFIAVSASSRALQAVFAAVVLVVVWRMWRPSAPAPTAATGLLEVTYHDPQTNEATTYGVRRFGSGFGLSVGAGVFAGMLGIGGGVFNVPIMNLLMGVPLRAAIATSNLMIGMTALASIPVFFIAGLVNPVVAVPAALGVLAGAQIGVRAATRLPVEVLRLFLAGLLTVFAVLMLLEAAGVAW